MFDYNCRQIVEIKFVTLLAIIKWIVYICTVHNVIISIIPKHTHTHTFPSSRRHTNCRIEHINNAIIKTVN